MATPTGEATQQRQRPTTRTRRTTGQNRRPSVKARNRKKIVSNIHKQNMKIIIAGAYTIGTYLAQFLSRNKYNIILIDEQEERLNKIGQDYDLLTLQGKPTSIQILQEADVKHADLFIAVDPKETTNITACTMAHHLGAKKTVAKIDNPEYLESKNQELFKQLGVDSLIYPELLAAKDIINGLKMSWVRQRWDVRGGALVMLGIKLRDTCAILDKPLREISGPNGPSHCCH